ncbi:type I secretion C-terminal target domain-containing protein [Rhizobium alvei]|uniref:Type I secretion C-terminal target domain-containing protein n=1 Tax=Rhizobium alvei TaxID=1132659 RepID=A0ABT8YFH4_9HYPH|nr:type I secretion C-terminal target domain-containing protein [Rhizobium alvei]MDO6962436.1 type I secretion C-terminal target domain-containing protein [Rhizobium alvei]
MGFLARKIFAEYRFQTSIYSPWFWGDVTVNSGIEIPASRNGGFFSVDFSDTQIFIDFNDIGVFTRYQANGFQFSDKYDALNPIVGVQLQTNMQSLTKSDIKVADDRVFIDWRGAAFTEGTYVTLTVKFKVIRLEGSDRADKLVGSNYDEYFAGLGGKDILTGGGGADLFMFSQSDTGSKKSTADVITDFSIAEGDKIDLRRMDADTITTGLQDFVFIGTKNFTKHAGEVRFEKSGSDTFVYGDTNGDATADFMIVLDDAITLTANQFLF